MNWKLLFNLLKLIILRKFLDILTGSVEFRSWTHFSSVLEFQLMKFCICPQFLTQMSICICCISDYILQHHLHWIYYFHDRRSVLGLLAATSYGRHYSRKRKTKRAAEQSVNRSACQSIWIFFADNTAATYTLITAGETGIVLYSVYVSENEHAKSNQIATWQCNTNSFNDLEAVKFIRWH